MENIEIVDSMKVLGTLINNQLSFDQNTNREFENNRENWRNLNWCCKNRIILRI